MQKTYRKNPVLREAIQFTGENFLEVHEFVGFREVDPESWRTAAFDRIGTNLSAESDEKGFMRHIAKLWVAANAMWVPIEPGDWIIKDSEGFYPCKDEIFRENYTLYEGGEEYYNDETLFKVLHAIYNAGVLNPRDVVNSLQNAGILFRERK